SCSVRPRLDSCPVSARTAIFFFQAEDGIRDPLVTGVQTCALPICLVSLRIGVVPLMAMIRTRAAAGNDTRPAEQPRFFLRADAEIGRASCRERVSSWGAAGAVEGKRRARTRSIPPRPYSASGPQTW